MARSTVILNQKQHAGLNWHALNDYSFAAAMNSVPLLAFEVKAAAACFPVVFPEGHMPRALLGLGEVNCFVDADGRWTAPYLPLILANYPFSLARAESEDGRRDLVVAIDPGAPHLRGKGKLLYSKGKATPLLEEISKTLAAQHARHEQAARALAHLTLSGVLVSQPLTLRRAGKDVSVGGLRVVDRAKVMALPANTLGQWVRLGLMKSLYAHWDSLRHLNTLLEHPSCPRKADDAPVQ